MDLDYDDYDHDQADDEPDYEPDPQDGYEPDPTDHPDFERREYERYLARLSPAGRLVARLRSVIWRYTWHWRIRRIRPGQWSDEPPF